MKHVYTVAIYTSPVLYFEVYTSYCFIIAIMWKLHSFEINAVMLALQVILR